VQLHGHCKIECGVITWELLESVRCNCMGTMSKCVASTWVLSVNVWCNYMGTVRGCVVQLNGYCQRVSGATT